MRTMKNATHIEGLLYQHNLEKRVTGPTSANPNTEYIRGTIDIATDKNLTNIVSINYTYVTATTKAGKANPTFEILNNIINHAIPSVMADGADKAGKLRCDSSINLNDFYVDRNGTTELVSTKRNDGGFIHSTISLAENEDTRNTFDCDIVITKVYLVEGDPEMNTCNKAVVGGYIFGFKNALLPVEFVATNPGAIDYFLGLEASETNPVLTHVKGNQISETIVTTVTEDSAFGAPSVREVRKNRKEFLITWAQAEPYLWNDESTMTNDELTTLKAEREVYLATQKQRREEYNASKSATAPVAPVSASGFNF